MKRMTSKRAKPLRAKKKEQVVELGYRLLGLLDANSALTAAVISSSAKLRATPSVICTRIGCGSAPLSGIRQ